MQVLHLKSDFHFKRLKPHMHNFGVTLNASIAYKVRLFQILHVGIVFKARSSFKDIQTI
jgi:hypothetical protein